MANRRAAVCIGLIGAVVGLIIFGVRLLMDRKYNLISILIAFFACVPFYLHYEKKEGSIRRMVLLAVMTAISVTGRFLFAPIPVFKPVAAVVILTGIFMGPESGFLVGSLSAIISNIFFGQGPWTPFQMLAWGLIGMIAGVPVLRNILQKRVPLAIYGMAAGVAYSAIMDIWTVISLEGRWNWSRYLLATATAIPHTIGYAISNVIFLMLTVKPIGEKLSRMQVKHGIF